MERVSREPLSPLRGNMEFLFFGPEYRQWVPESATLSVDTHEASILADRPG